MTRTSNDIGNDYVSLKLKDRIEYLSSQMGRGICKDYVDYQNLCGEIKGIEFALEIIQELKAQMEKEEDNG